MVYSTDLNCWWVKKHTGDDNNKHLIHFLVCNGCTCVSVFDERCSQEAIFFCFGFTLFQLPRFTFWVCLFGWGGALCEIWAYFKLIIYCVHMGLKKMPGWWDGREILQQLYISIVYFDLTLALSSSSAYFCLHDDVRVLLLVLYMMVWIERTIYLYNTHTQTNRRGEARGLGHGRLQYNVLVLGFAFITTTNNISFVGVLEVFSEDIVRVLNVCVDFSIVCWHDDDNDTMTTLWLITIWLKCKLHFFSFL